MANHSPEYRAWLNEFLSSHRDYPMLSIVRPEDVSEITVMYHFASALYIVPVSRSVENGMIVEKSRPCHNCFIQFRNLDTGVIGEKIPLPVQTVGMTMEQISNLVGNGSVQAEYTEYGESNKIRAYDIIRFPNEPLQLEDWQVQLLKQDPRMQLAEEK